jgi:Siphovirus Gp157
MNLYELTTELRELLDSAFDPETGELLPVFEEKRALWGSKARDVTAYLLNCESNAAQCKSHITQVKKRMDREQKKADSLRDYLRENMKASGITSLKAEDGSFEAKLYIERDKSVVIEDGATFPPELCNPPKPLEPSKKLIEAAILRGEPIAGASIVKKDRLTIS